jgi:hypothetical protein
MLMAGESLLREHPDGENLNGPANQEWEIRQMEIILPAMSIEAGKRARMESREQSEPG